MSNKSDASPHFEQMTDHDLNALAADISTALGEAKKDLETGSEDKRARAGQEIADWENELGQIQAELAKRSLGQALP
jgi:hypothetical protein